MTDKTLSQQQPGEFTPQLRVPDEVQTMLRTARSCVFANSREQLIQLAMGGSGADRFEVAYELPDRGQVAEAEVIRCKNGLAVNYTEAYMRRRDPDCMVVADERPTDKRRYGDAFSHPFPVLRQEILDWLAAQDLLLLAFQAGGTELGVPGLLIAPTNASFFAAGLANLQTMLTADQLPQPFTPKVLIYLAPPFRHTHCDGRQIVIHHRSSELHEIYSLNLYPGPSARRESTGP